jgi:4-carboxymuconolactone decarboxylase
MSIDVAQQRISPLEPPYAPEVAETLRRMMPPDVEPLRLFRTVAHNPAVLERFRTIGAYILNFGRVEALDREVLLHRTCARCGCEYEWGVHAVAFGRPLGMSDQQLRATVLEGPGAPVWSERQRLLVRLADELHDTATVSDPLWSELSDHWDSGQLIELIATAGFYHLVSFTANAAAVQPEPYAERFPTPPRSGSPSG